MEFLKKILIKDYKDTANPAVRFRYGLTAGIIGIVSNMLLFAFKLLVGILSASITIIADAINNLSDAGSSVVTLIGFKLSARPADKEHPFGHARFEYISALIVALVVLVIGVLLLKSSIEKIVVPSIVTINTLTYIILAIAIVMKFFQMLIYRNFAKSIESGTLKASAADSRNDVLTTIAVLISTIIIDQTGVNIDGYMGVAVSLFIIISSLKLIKDTMDPILGTEPDRELVEKIRKKLLSYDGVIGIHDLMIHNYGASSCFVIVHVEVPANVDIMKSHDIIDNIEHDFASELGLHLNIHMDPVDTEDSELEALKERSLAVLERLNTELGLHDFRLVRGETHTNILFDVVIPFDCKVKKAEIEDALKEEFKNDSVVYYFVIDVDR
ncbi:MAG: cation diffusion facilitator family transporter [Clostridia bacterium]